MTNSEARRRFDKWVWRAKYYNSSIISMLGCLTGKKPSPAEKPESWSSAHSGCSRTCMRSFRGEIPQEEGNPGRSSWRSSERDEGAQVATEQLKATDNGMCISFYTDSPACPQLCPGQRARAPWPHEGYKELSLGMLRVAVLLTSQGL